MSLESLASGWTCTLQHPSDVGDSSGGVDRLYVNDTFWNAFPAGIQPLSAQEKWANGQRLIFVTHRMYLAFDIAAKRGDRILVAESGQTLIIEGYRNVAGQNRMWVVEVREQT